ncbi:MAG: SMC-Scp complex subunit ScpB, partial [Coriobacteriia bacterium]|nr:SMC-Scp complex subunit ScpB [Coriobacteriia bacterium]
AILYGTTTAFLEKFGLSSIKELPPLEQFTVKDEMADAIRERLDSELSVTDDLGIAVEEETDEDLGDPFREESVVEIIG